jgi:quercetin dioxygenase-like cupin family protein
MTMPTHHEVIRPPAGLEKIVALAAFVFASSSAPVLAQTPAAPPAIATKMLMQDPLGDTDGPQISLYILTVRAGVTIPSHSHKGAVFAYILEGNIENQVEPDPPKLYHAAGFFHESPMQVHRLLRNLSKTETAKLLIFQNGVLPSSVKPLVQAPLANVDNPQVSVISLVAAPAATSTAHQHPGPVFAYVLRGEVESQVDPDPPKVYRAGDVFYEPPSHAHRLFRNLSGTDPAELLIFQVSEKGQPLATSVEK